MLPFNGDYVPSVNLPKMAPLAADDKMTDPAICGARAAFLMPRLVVVRVATDGHGP
jgi:hypothetical protein